MIIKGSGQWYRLIVENGKPCLYQNDVMMGQVLSAKFGKDNSVTFEILTAGRSHQMLTVTKAEFAN